MYSVLPENSLPKPDEGQLNQAWQKLTLTRNKNWTPAARNLIEEFEKCFLNGGLKLDKFTLDIPPALVWHTSRNEFEDIHLLNKIARHPGLAALRSELQITDPRPELKNYACEFHLFSLAGQIAAHLSFGGAYAECDPLRAWKLATAFVAEEFENRFFEICYFPVRWKQAGWFYNIAWDYSAILFDKGKHEMIFLNATDTD